MPERIKYVSLYKNTGYGIAASLYLKALLESDLEITWTPMVHGRSIGLPYEPFSGKVIKKQIVGYCLQ